MTLRMLAVMLVAILGVAGCSNVDGGGGSSLLAAGGPRLDVTPGMLDFGIVPPGETSDITFSVRNAGGGVLAGTAATATPFSIVDGSSYALASGQSQTITVRFSPMSALVASGSVTCTGGGGAAVPLRGACLGVPGGILRIVLETNKPTYVLGEDVVVRVVASNPGPTAVTLEFSTSMHGDYTIDGPAFRWSAGHVFLQVLTSVTVPPGGTADLLDTTHRPQDFALTAGTHIFVGSAWTTNMGKLVSAPVFITVQ
jgi:hypothetical protein